jgi:hypothetical protein
MLAATGGAITTLLATPGIFYFEQRQIVTSSPRSAFAAGHPCNAHAGNKCRLVSNPMEFQFSSFHIRVTWFLNNINSPDHMHRQL